jgi:hypothetical protein
MTTTMMDQNGSGADGVEIAGQLFKLEEPLTTTRGYGRHRMFTKVPAALGRTNPADKMTRPVLYYPGHTHIRESSSHGSNNISDGIDHASPSPPLSLTLSLYISIPGSLSLSSRLAPLSLKRVWGEMYRHPSTFPAEPRQFRTHLTVDKAHTDPFRSGRFFSGFCNLNPRLFFHPFVRLGGLSLFFFFFSARNSVLYLPCAFYSLLFIILIIFFQLSNAVVGCPFLFFTLKIAQRLLVGRTLLLL